MNLADYEQFKEFEARGLKRHAKEAVQKFVDSFDNDHEREAWVRGYLEGEKPQFRVRHEIFERLVFPVLLTKYRKHDMWATLWLAKLIQNLYSAQFLHKAIEYKTENQLLRDCLTWSPANQEVREALLRSQIRQFDFYEHEYPSAILYGIDGATLEDCGVLCLELELARGLDDRGKYTIYLDSFEEKLDEYQARFTN